MLGMMRKKYIHVGVVEVVAVFVDVSLAALDVLEESSKEFSFVVTLMAPY